VPSTRQLKKSPKGQNSVACHPVTGGQSQADVAKALAKLRRLSEFSPAKLDILASQITVQRLHKRSLIYSESQSDENLYIMLSGIARLTCENRKRESILLEVLGPGDIIGLPSLLPDVRHHLRCEAFTNCELGLISARSLVEDVIGVPFADFTLGVKLTVSRWWELLVRQAHFIDQPLAERVLIALRDLGAKFGVEEDRGIILNAPINQRDLADLVAASRPKVNVVLRGLAKIGALIQEGPRRIVLVPKKLESSQRLSFGDAPLN
jgi:CRP/FNR family cyclic AMP-dependent transcriptional regulator